MPRYYFDLVDTTDAVNVNGAILDDDEAASKVAQDLARDVRADRPELLGRGYAIVVRTEGGDQILRVPVDRTSKDGDGV